MRHEKAFKAEHQNVADSELQRKPPRTHIGWRTVDVSHLDDEARIYTGVGGRLDRGMCIPYKERLDVQLNDDPKVPRYPINHFHQFAARAVKLLSTIISASI